MVPPKAENLPRACTAGRVHVTGSPANVRRGHERFEEYILSIITTIMKVVTAIVVLLGLSFGSSTPAPPPDPAPIVNPQKTEWSHYEVVNPQLLRIHVTTGVEPCVGLEAVADESEREVRIDLLTGPRKGSEDKACIAKAEERHIDVPLKAPLSDRIVTQ